MKENRTAFIFITPAGNPAELPGFMVAHEVNPKAVYFDKPGYNFVRCHSYPVTDMLLGLGLIGKHDFVSHDYHEGDTVTVRRVIPGTAYRTEQDWGHDDMETVATYRIQF